MQVANKNRIDRDSVKSLVLEGYNDVMISEILECTQGAICNIRNLELGIGSTSARRNHIDRDLVLSLAKQGYRHEYIAEQANCSKYSVVRILQEVGYKKPRSARRTKRQMAQDQQTKN